MRILQSKKVNASLKDSSKAVFFLIHKVALHFIFILLFYFVIMCKSGFFHIFGFYVIIDPFYLIYYM